MNTHTHTHTHTWLAGWLTAASPKRAACAGAVAAGAGSTWATCDSWLVDYQLANYRKKLGRPMGDAALTSSAPGGGDKVYTRRFASGTHVRLHMPAGSEPDRGGSKRVQPDPKLR